MPTHDARCAASGKASSSQPISAKSVSSTRLPDACDGIEALHRLFQGTEPFLDLVVESANGSLQRIDHAQQFPQQKAMVRPHASLQGRDQRLAFVRRSQQCQIGQHLGPLFSLSQSRQDGAPGFAHEVRKDRTELDVRLF
jgi:hypothetical protein